MWNFILLMITLSRKVAGGQASEITKKHTHILQREPVLLTDIVEKSESYEITKIMPIATDNEDKKRVSDVLEQFTSKASISW